MCELGYHVCPDCGEEFKCTQSDSECPALVGYEEPCAKCEWWMEQVHSEQEKHDRMMWEREQWENEHVSK